MKHFLLPAFGIAALACSLSAKADLVAHYPMDVANGKITEKISGQQFTVEGHFSPENLPGAEGQALRFDGYTSYINAQIGNVITDSKNMTVSMWVAVPCYPIIQIDVNTPTQTPIINCLDETQKTGFGFFIGFDGKYSFKTYIGGWEATIKVDTPLPTYTWNNLVAVVDGTARSLTLYNNGQPVGTARANGNCSIKASTLYMGQGTLKNFSGPFQLTSYNGLIDDIKVWNEAIPQSTIQSWTPENPANLDIPASRYEGQILRPRFHGMPATAWTNECHGMTYADGRYHVFFQKNADGPYMARLHWGHISSENLYDWQEEKIAIAPGDWYDIKGCWSGCVFTDDVITGGKPNIIYTAVDYGRAMIAGASPLDASLDNWQKWSNNPIINGRPNGLSDDFRDPYFFRNGSNAYIIVGSSKDGVGTTTLHRYDPASKTWTNTGDLFFTGTSASTCGTFWEMPNITPMPDGKWLFTATPLGINGGVKTIYYTGTINPNGTFNPNSTTPQQVELVAKEGFGLLSPTIYQKDGKTIVLGIVPDKLPSEENWNLGWAHCYSLPREWSIDESNNLIQKPYSGLTGMRTASKFEKNSFTLNGSQNLTPVEGREAELLGVFTVGTNPFGFKIFKNSAREATITFNPSTNELIADFSRLLRLNNDGWLFNGVYRASLPRNLPKGSECKMNIFIDHSIVDIFINDKYATSIRVFPTEADANGIEAFANGDTEVKSLQAWIVNPSYNAGVENVIADPEEVADPNRPVDVYTISGQLVRRHVIPSEATVGLPAGLYIVGNKKVAIH